MNNTSHSLVRKQIHSFKLFLPGRVQMLQHMDNLAMLRPPIKHSKTVKPR